MKLVCDFCKTEYSVANPPSCVRCAICGHVFDVAQPSRRGNLLVFLASGVALLAAAVFAFVVIMHHNQNAKSRGPLIATISEIGHETDESGVSHFVVSGVVANVSDDIYGVPDLIIVSRDGNGNVLARQKFLPSATLLDSGGHAEFKHTLAASVSGVKKITVELGELSK